MALYVEDLSKPSGFPENPDNIRVVHTHTSVVFIGDEIVYKIKKPVNFGFLDYSTLEKRFFFCNKEAELNRRLSEGVYLGVVPVSFDGEKYRINGTGQVVDYAVKMRKLPKEDLLKNRFLNDDLSLEDVERVAKRIADFHLNAETSAEIDKYGKIEIIKFNTDENFTQTEEFISTSITENQYYELKQWTSDFYKENDRLFKDRIKKNRIRDCHGDLHMEHIYLTDPIIIYDCIEFNDRFRYSDTLADIAFLLMDLEFNNGKKVSDTLCKIYFKKMGEGNDANILIDFYKVYRAYVRGKVISFMLKDPNISYKDKEDAKKTSKRYFNLAYSYITKENT
jgi:aminoglycoside phosphotransferase family enzyme